MTDANDLYCYEDCSNLDELLGELIQEYKIKQENHKKQEVNNLTVPLNYQDPVHDDTSFINDDQEISTADFGPTTLKKQKKFLSGEDTTSETEQSNFQFDSQGNSVEFSDNFSLPPSVLILHHSSSSEFSTPSKTIVIRSRDISPIKLNEVHSPDSVRSSSPISKSLFTKKPNHKRSYRELCPIINGTTLIFP
jgi:hypothetical protein